VSTSAIISESTAIIIDGSTYTTVWRPSRRRRMRRLNNKSWQYFNGRRTGHQKQHHVPYSLAILLNGTF
jgi:hypothetical protein